MSPEWQRRAMAIGLTFAFVFAVREFEPGIGRATGVPPVWITRASALAILVMCFRLADMIPDDEWRLPAPARPRAVHFILAALSAVLVVMSYGAAH